MPSVRVSEHSELPPEIVLTAARDFSDRNAQMWPDVHVEYLQVHEVGEDYAEVTEGNPWPIGHVWERLRYDWSEEHSLRGTVIDSNLFKRGSTWELWATPADGGSRVEIRAVRRLRGRGWLLAPFFLPFIPGSAAKTVRDHLRHFLASIERPDAAAAEGPSPKPQISRHSGIAASAEVRPAMIRRRALPLISRWCATNERGS